MATATATPAAEIKAIPVRHPWRWVAAVVIAALAALWLYVFIAEPNLVWSVVGDYLFNDRILLGVEGTITLTIIAMVMGAVGGVILSLMRLSPNPVMSTISWLYIWFFRGTPVLVQLFFWFNLPIILKYIGVGIPGTPLWWTAQTKDVVTPFLAAILGLGLNEAAYMAEIVRAGIISVEQGQTEAAQSLGMRRMQVMTRIVLPQAIRVIIPPTGNETISMLKTSSLAFITTYGELFKVQQEVSSFNFKVEELLIVVSLWYLFMTSILTIGQYYLERYFARGTVRQLPMTPLQRFRHLLLNFHAPPPQPVAEPVIGIAPGSTKGGR